MVCQKFILKLHSSRLRKAKWKLTLPLDEARRNDEIISLADSQVLRWLDELNGITDAEGKARNIKSKIKRLRREPNSVQSRKQIKQLYAQLDDIQFKPDYLCVIIDKEKDYHRACRGFSINGLKYQRLLGTNGGVKNETIVFISERYADEIRRRIDNGRNPEIEMVPAKLEAYKALTCSASIPVSMPNGVLVVPDCETRFKSDFIYLTDECDGEPSMELKIDEIVELDESDGYGIMLPSLAQRWSDELHLDYMMSGANTRCSWEKGMVFTFDFIDFADKVAGKYIVKDAWGNDVDIRNVELVLTTSMLKLWDSYSSCDDYLQNCIENGYSFCITKTCPKELERERNLNYQFIQSYDLDDDDIEELIAPTMNEIKDILGGDWRKTVLYLKGVGLNEDNVDVLDDDWIKAIMIEPKLMEDPYIKNKVYQLIKNRINQAKVGVLKVHGNYSIISGDPYSLCQSIFGLEVTGLLKAGEIHNKYWCDTGADKLVCFRAPMTAHPNIRAVKPTRDPDALYWYQYMNTCTIFNSWDTAAHALNGADKDGDLVMLTDNPVLVRKHKEMPAIMCAQRRAVKKIVTEEDAIYANIASFGNDIGKTTNWITSMFEVQSRYPKESKEYKTLEYRIMCGQLYQQNTIDKAKGIIAKPMPKEWHDWFAINNMDADDDTKNFYRSVVAEKKPYFMCYIYPDLMKSYKDYTTSVSRICMQKFNKTIDEINQTPFEKLTEEEVSYVSYVKAKFPVGMGDCVMNKICRRFEDEFDSCIRNARMKDDFDYSIMKSGADIPYNRHRYSALKLCYAEYAKSVKQKMSVMSRQRKDNPEISDCLRILRDGFSRDCDLICSNEVELTDMLMHICYRKSYAKDLMWSTRSEQIIKNLLLHNGEKIHIPTQDENGDVKYCGKKFIIITKDMETI